MHRPPRVGVPVASVLSGRALGLVLGMVLVALVPWGARPASAQGTAGPCSDATGITVVVDFQALGRETIVRCAPQPVESGFDALTRAGISFAAVTTVPGVVCHMHGVPADDPCASMPASDFYWSYWNAEAGGEWAYAQVGAADSRPAPGNVEGWSFVSDGARSRTTEPRRDPPARPEPNQGPGVDAPALPVDDADAPAPPELAPPEPQAQSPASAPSGTSASGQGQAAAAPATDADPPAAEQPGPTEDDQTEDDPRDAGSAGGDSPDDDADDNAAEDRPAAADDADDNAEDEAQDDPEPRPSAFDAAEPVDRPTPFDPDEVAVGGRGSASAETDAVHAAGGSTQGILTDDGSGGGPPPSTLAGIGLILILGTSAGLVANRRRDQRP